MGTPLAAVILAAGKGTRMGLDLPKVLHEVAGKPMVVRLLDALEAAGVRRTVVVVGTRGEAVKRALRGRQAGFALQRQPLGTGHALRQAEKALRGFRGVLLVLPGDAPLIRPETLRDLAARCRAGSACAVLTAEVADPTGYGRVLRNGDGEVAGIAEEANATPGQRRIREVNSAIYAFRAEALWPALRDLPWSRARKGREIYLPDVLPALSARGLRVEALETRDPTEVLGFNTPWELVEVEARIRLRILKTLMASGVRIADPATTFIETEIPVGKGTLIHPFTVIRRGVRIGRDCQVGPFAHLREGTVLEDGAEVGDFVETKKARLGSRSKAKHLAYLGDVLIGRRVNIGAGTIVANYDGKAKHQTAIGDGAFIGSGTVLVAPVRIGKRAMTGAGAVVTKGHDVTDGEVVAGVPARPFPSRVR
jgi:bifunctional UDP-N-acetylglucosamine pyrophosphorylase/glucosamine-1-phosphate N-acetyltransferase